jgi:hypothetical protein
VLVDVHQLLVLHDRESHPVALVGGQQAARRGGGGHRDAPLGAGRQQGHAGIGKDLAGGASALVCMQPGRNPVQHRSSEQQQRGGHQVLAEQAGAVPPIARDDRGGVGAGNDQTGERDVALLAEQGSIAQRHEVGAQHLGGVAQAGGDGSQRHGGDQVGEPDEPTTPVTHHPPRGHDDHTDERPGSDTGPAVNRGEG